MRGWWAVCYRFVSRLLSVLRLLVSEQRAMACVGVWCTRTRMLLAAEGKLLAVQGQGAAPLCVVCQFGAFVFLCHPKYLVTYYASYLTPSCICLLHALHCTCSVLCCACGVQALRLCLCNNIACCVVGSCACRAHRTLSGSQAKSCVGCGSRPALLGTQPCVGVPFGGVLCNSSGYV